MIFYYYFLIFSIPLFQDLIKEIVFSPNKSLKLILEKGTNTNRSISTINTNNSKPIKSNLKKSNTKNKPLKKSSIQDKIINKEDDLINLKSIHQCENYFFPYNKDRDFQKLDSMKKYLKSNLIKINDDFYAKFENKINFLAESRKLPNFKALVMQSLSFNKEVDKNISNNNNNVEEDILKNDTLIKEKSNKELENIGLIKTMKKIEHPNIIDPFSLLQLNVMKRFKQLKLDNERKEALKKQNEIQVNRNKFNENVVLMKQHLDDINNKDEDMLGFFKYKIKQFNEVFFEKGRAAECILNQEEFQMNKYYELI